MKTIQIYIIEDSVEYPEALKFEIEVPLNNLGINPEFIHRVNDNTLEQDLFVGVDLILIDYDLGEINGDTIIAKIDSFPDHKSTKIIFYSGGESVESLRQKTISYSVICTTKNDLAEKIISVLKSGSK